MGLELIKPNTSIDFMGMRKVMALLSALILLVALGTILARGGLNYGIDFAGGINIQVQFDRDVDVGHLNSVLEEAGLPDSRAQQFGSADLNQYMLQIPEGVLEPEEMRSTVQEVLAGSLEAEHNIQRLEMVGPRIGDELREKALQALFFAVLLISIYISGRFEQKWGTAGIMAVGLLLGVYLLQTLGVPMIYLVVSLFLLTLGISWYLRLNYALGAVLALAHDVAITVGIFSMLGKEFEVSTVAALLTIMGYSLNDSIVVFDRIRENIRAKSELSMYDLVNTSINQTLSRTLITSGTTLLVVLSLVFLGGGVIHDFAIALLIGVIAGTYSSIYIAGSVVLTLGPTPEEGEAEEEEEYRVEAP